MSFYGDGFALNELNADEDNGFLHKSSNGAFASLDFDSNDPYRDTGDVTRGVSMGQFGGWPGQMHKLSHDLYADDDDVMRGCSMAHAPLHDSLFAKPTDDGDLFSIFMPQGFGQPMKDGPSRLSRSSSMPSPPLSLQGSDCSWRFNANDAPPAPPKTEHFHFESTTSFITTQDVHKVANSILDFLDTQIIASVSKVRQQKYSIKVTMFLDHIMCTTKIRIWRVESKPNHYAIEFQRRAGDPFAFGDGYRQCIDFITSQYPGIISPGDSIAASGTEQQLSMPQPPPHSTEGSERSDEELEAELFSVLDLAGMAQFPHLQAEAASALAKLACDDLYIARYLSKAGNLDKLLPLLSCDSTDVVYPTARMLSAVATHATSPLAEHGVSKVVIKKISDPNSSQIVRLELAKAFSAAVHSCPHLISTDQACDLEILLESTMQELSNTPAMDVVVSTLQDVLIELKPYCYRVN